MSFSFCLNKNEILLLAGFGLLFLGLDLNRKGKLIQDSQRLISSAIEILERNGAAGTTEFKKLACAMINVDRGSRFSQVMKTEVRSRRKSDTSMAAPKTVPRSARKQLQAIASRFSNSSRTIKQENSKNSRRSRASGTASNSLFFDRNESMNSVSSVVSDPTSQHGYLNAVTKFTPPRQIASPEQPSLEFLAFSQGMMPYSTVTSETRSKEFDIEHIAGFLATQQPNGPPCDNVFHSSPEVISTYISPSSSTYDWSSEIWAMPSGLNSNTASAQSVLSFSEEDVTSGEELSSCDARADFQGILMPNVEGYGRLEGFEGFSL